MELEVRHLRTLTTVASLGSITKAAAVLGVAQPALSAQLARIDRALGGPTFVRDHRGVRPTPLGALVLDRARTLLPAMDALRQDARRVACGDTAATLRLAGAGSALAAPLVRRLSSGGDPPPTLRAVPDTARAVAELAAGAHDAVLAGTCGDALPPAHPGVQWRLLGTDAVHVVVGEGHPGGGDVRLAELADARWVTAAGDSCFTECFLRACARAGFTPPTPSECDRAEALELVRAGVAVALTQPYGALPAGLRALTLRGTPLTWSTWLATHDDTATDVRTRLVGAARDARREELAAARGRRGGTSPDLDRKVRPAV
ncbi:LysR family transcriptional regulator [Cellulomonas dongxiuzhuiae]|uniref:LysR family transcriptional regulator n=1 Tax=Cellulomonas dongxiuzhuiae TaxID=2819979 RepID=UPI001AAF4147|nr:LysR family transcriptional regulator [Cellulomonas dongxiuzhuiae]MBO3088198.1 LysR family transcriptional regulator [Cellulomonas dongxiuzhuiae]